MPLRDILVTGFFVFAAIYALKRPYYGALLWVWIGIMNPHRLTWSFAFSLPFAMAAAAVTMLGLVLHYKEARWPRGAPVVVLILFTIWMGLTTVSAIHLEPSIERYIEVLKVMVMTVVVGMLVRTRNEIVGLVWVIVLSLGYYGVKGGIFTIMTGGAHRVWGPPASIIQSNNELAVALIMALPLMYFLAQEIAVAARFPVLHRIGEKWLRRGLYVAMALCAAAAIGSQSRGAFLAIIAMSAMLWWRSKSKVTIGVILIVLAPVGLLSMPDHWFDRMQTIQTYEEDASAMGRINAWTMAINIANDRTMGAGFTTATRFVYELYAPDPGKTLVAHSIYFQVLGEHGYIGLALYLLFWYLTYRTAGRLVRSSRGVAELSWAETLGNMAKVSIVGFAVGGAFLSIAYWDMPYYLMMALVCANMLVNERLRALAEAGSAALAGPPPAPALKA